MGDSREPSRCVGEWRGGSDIRNGSGDGRSAGDGRTSEAGMEAEADDDLLRVGRRGAWAAGLDGMGGDTP